MTKNETRGIRWGELLPCLQERAQSECVTVPEIAKRAVREYLGLSNNCPAEIVKYQRLGQGISSFDAVRVRFGLLTPLLVKRATAEGASVSSIVRRAARLYLANQELPKVEQFQDELEHLRREVARIGGNLNQVAVHMNFEGTLKTTELGQAHIELQKLFGEMVTLYKRMEKNFEQRIP
ncbi:plasmid mobilization relaxosome protein MobC [Humidesulfovibrio sp.]